MITSRQRAYGLIMLLLAALCSASAESDQEAAGFCDATGGCFEPQFTAHGLLAPQPVAELDGRTQLIDHRQLLLKRQPLVIRHDPIVAQWPALRGWHPAYMSRRLPVLPAYVQQYRSRFITFHDSKPLEPWIVGERWAEFNRRPNVTTHELFGSSRRQPAVPLEWQYVDGHNASQAPGPWAFFSARLELLEPLWPTIVQETSPHEMLLEEQPQLPQRNLWLGRAGLVTAMHHDSLWNVFAQVHGCKLFTLLPPQAPLYLYPCQHPHYGHAQIDLTLPAEQLQQDLEKYFPAAAAAQPLESYEVKVCAGDTLIIPPLWFHQVLTLSDSNSVNAWSSAPEFELIDEVYSLPLPFEAHWSRSRIMASAAEYFAVLVSEALSSTLEQEAHELAATRWAPLLAAGKIKLDVVVDGLLGSACKTVAEVGERRQGLPTLAKIRERASEAAGLLQQIEVVSIRRIMVHNYIEHVSALLASPGAVPSVLVRCFGAQDWETR